MSANKSSPKARGKARVTVDMSIEERQQLRDAAARASLANGARVSMQELIRSLLRKEVFTEVK